MNPTDATGAGALPAPRIEGTPTKETQTMPLTLEPPAPRHDETTTRAILAAIVAADEGFAEAAEAIDRGSIDQTTYQRAADRLYGAIETAREYLGGA